MTANIRIVSSHYVVPAQHPGQFRAVFGAAVKEAVIGGQTYCAVPYSLDAARVLVNMGLKVPSPIRTDYEWPDGGGRFKPRWYQIETAEHLTLNPRTHCHNAPRTGKTLSSLWAADYLRQKGAIRRTLIVAPLSTLWDVWERDIFGIFPLRTFAVLHGSAEYRKRMLRQPCDFYITNHHGIMLLEKDLAKRPDINHVIIDEVSKYRNGYGRGKGKTLFQPMDRVLNSQGIPRTVWGLTGTPTPNSPVDAVAQSKLVTPNNYHGSLTSWKDEVTWQVGEYKRVPKPTAKASVARILSPTIRFERTVCTDLEPCYIERRAELSKEQETAYKQLLKDAKAEIGAGVVTAVNAAALLTKITQVACGAVLDGNKNVIHCDFGPRLAVLEELIEENDEKVLVFVPFKGVVDALAVKLKKHWSVETVDGRTTARERGRIFQDFRSKPDPHVLVCHPEVMSHGLDLTAATLSIWYAPITKAEVFQQANARMDGSKQMIKIDIASIYATKEEKRIYEVIGGKGTFQDAVLELLKDGGR